MFIPRMVGIFNISLTMFSFIFYLFNKGYWIGANTIHYSEKTNLFIEVLINDTNRRWLLQGRH